MTVFRAATLRTFHAGAKELNVRFDIKTQRHYFVQSKYRLVNKINFFSFRSIKTCPSDNLALSASFLVSLLFVWLRLSQNQATCAHPKALGRTNRHTITSKS